MAKLQIRTAMKNLSNMLFARRPIRRRLLQPMYDMIDYENTVGNGSTSSIVMACVNWITRNFNQAKIQTVRVTADGVEEVLAGHEITQLLMRPNNFYSGSILWGATIQSLIIDGNAYWMKVQNNAGLPVELWFVPCNMIKPVRTSSTDFISHYEYSLDDRKIRVQVEDVIHLRHGLDPKNQMLGISPLKTLMREIYTDEEAANFTAWLVKNHGVIGLIVSPEGGEDEFGGIDDEDLNVTREYFETSFTGTNRGKPLVMGWGVKVDQLGFNPQEMDLGTIRNIPEERITATLGIPAAVVGLGTGIQQTGVGATLRELRREAWVGTIIPLQEDLLEQLKGQLLVNLPNSEDISLIFDRSDISDLRESPNELASMWSTLVSGAISSRADAKRALGLPVEATDEVYLMPLSVIEVPVGQSLEDSLPETPAPEPEPEFEPDDDEDEEPDNDDDDDGDEETASVGKTYQTKRTLKSTAEQRQLIRALKRDAGQLERAFRRDLAPILRDLGNRAADAYIDARRGTTARTKPMQTKQTPEDLLLIADIIDMMQIVDWQSNRMAPAFRGHYSRSLSMTVDTINSVANLGVNIPDHRARDIISQGGRRMGLIDFTAQTRNRMFRIMHQARAEGWGTDEVARRIRDDIPSGPWRNQSTRAKVIARTESKFAQNISSIEAYQQSDTITGVVAFDAQLGDTDADCQQRNQRTYTFQQARSLTSSEHPNGTLSWAPARRQVEDPGFQEQPLEEIPEPSREELDRAIEDITKKPTGKWGGKTTEIEGEYGDTWLRDYATRRHGRQKAQIVDGEIFDQLEGEVMFRGITQLEHVDAFIDGTTFGLGVTGNGQYYGAGKTLWEGFNMAKFDEGGWVYAAKLSRNAKVADYDELKKLQGTRLGESLGDKKRMDFITDMGRFAADEGYDAIKVPGTDVVVIVNNRAVVVDRRSLPGEAFERQVQQTGLDRVALQADIDQLENEIQELFTKMRNDEISFDEGFRLIEEVKERSDQAKLLMDSGQNSHTAFRELFEQTYIQGK